MVIAVLASLLLILGSSAVTGEMILDVSNAEAAAGVCGPASARVDLAELFGAGIEPARLRLVESSEAGEALSEPIQLQFEADGESASRGTLWWLMPPGPKGRPRGNDCPLALAKSRGNAPIASS